MFSRVIAWGKTLLDTHTHMHNNFTLSSEREEIKDRALQQDKISGSFVQSESFQDNHWLLWVNFDNTPNVEVTILCLLPGSFKRKPGCEEVTRLTKSDISEIYWTVGWL